MSEICSRVDGSFIKRRTQAKFQPREASLILALDVPLMEPILRIGFPDVRSGPSYFYLGRLLRALKTLAFEQRKLRVSTIFYFTHYHHHRPRKLAFLQCVFEQCRHVRAYKAHLLYMHLEFINNNM